MQPITNGSNALATEEHLCACGGRLESHTVHRYRFEDEFGRVIEAHNVPALVCRRCGDVVLDRPVLADIETRIAHSFFVPRHVNLAH